MKKNALAIICLLLLQTTIYAQLRLPAIIASDMVLQQNSEAHLWGWSGPAEKIYITTSWDNKTDSTIATRDAKWMIAVPTPKAGGPYTITIKADKTILLTNILIGEVWVCSGQSNMEMNSGWGLPEINAEFSQCANKNIRFFQVPKTTAKYPQDDVKGYWGICDSNSLRNFSAVGYFFGKKLNNELQVPVGLISSNWGGTSSEVWTPEDAVGNNAQLKYGAGKIPAADWWPYTVGACFNGMIAPLTSFNIAGVIWYQGESNTEISSNYKNIFTTMIDGWRRAWDKDLPFYYVQIAPFNYGNPNSAAVLREQQTNTLSHHNVGMVVSTDLVDTVTDIHPKQKKAVGYRLANYALAETYNHPGDVYRSPLYKKMEIVKDKINIYFDYAPNGITIKGDAAKEVYIAGADKKFVPATIKIEKDFITVSAKSVANPVAVRFGFSNAGIGNLFSKEGLPVIPFRTDDWLAEGVQ